MPLLMMQVQHLMTSWVKLTDRSTHLNQDCSSLLLAKVPKAILMVQGREILLIVTGGIAAYKSAELTSRLVQDGALVSVVMTGSCFQIYRGSHF